MHASPSSSFAAALPFCAFSALFLPPSCGGRSEGLSQDELEALTEEIQGEVEDLRGLQFERPFRVAIATREEFVAYAKERIEKVSSLEEIGNQESIAKLLGMFPFEQDLVEETFAVLEEQVGGFYDPGADAFFLMEGFGGDLARVILAHELTHALDDQHFDIDGTIERLAGNSDALFAYHAVVEGSGTAVMNRWMLERMTELDPAALAESGAMSTEAVEDAAPYLWKPLLGTYLCGASFLARADSLMGGQMSEPQPDDFDRAFRTPPASSEQILHPAKYWEEAERDAPTTVAVRVGELPLGWAERYQDTLGELHLALATQPLDERGGLDPAAILNLSFTGEPARGWDGDRCVLFGKGEARALVSLSVWDSQEEADEFLAGMLALQQHLLESVQGYTAALGGEQGSVTLEKGPLPNSVLVAVGAHVESSELEGLVAGVRFEASPSAEDSATR